MSDRRAIMKAEIEALRQQCSPTCATTTACICGTVDANGMLDRVLALVDAAPVVSGSERDTFFAEFIANPCNICGGKRNWSVDGQPQAVCHECGNPAVSVPEVEGRRIGQPEGMWMDEYGSLLVGVFGYCVYHVGSSVSRQKGWSDVDVRVILSDEQYAAWGLGDPKDDHRSPRWLGLCKAFSELGKRITGLPIDFQIQQQTAANMEYGDKYRSALFKHDGSTIASDDLPESQPVSVPTPQERPHE